MLTRFVIPACALVLALFAGCGPGNEEMLPAPPVLPAAAAPDPQALFDRWKAIVMDPEKARGGMAHVEVALQLSLTAPQYVDKMIDMLTDPAVQPESRFLVLNSLEAAHTPESYPRLLALTKPEVDPAVRAGIVMVLKNALDTAVTARLQELTNDPERRVRMAALMVLSEKGDKAMRAALQQYYFTEGLPREHRARMLHSLGLAPEASDLKVFSAAANDATLPDESRLVAVNGLVLVGDPAGIPALEQCAASAMPQLKDAAENAAKELAAKAGAATPPAPASGAAQ